MMDCELCGGDERGFPGDIHSIPVLICISCMRRSKLTENGNLREQVETWMWKRRVLRKLKAPLPDRLRARTKWLMVKHEYDAKLEAAFIRSTTKHLNLLIERVEKGIR